MSREFAFYCPELDCIVIQIIIMEECHVAFEFDWKDLARFQMEMRRQGIITDDPFDVIYLIPLGEV